MSDSAVSYKVLAFQGDRPSQIEWLNSELNEFITEEPNSPAWTLEFLDVLGCLHYWGDEEMYQMVRRKLYLRWYPTSQDIQMAYPGWAQTQRLRNRLPISRATLLKIYLEHILVEDDNMPRFDDEVAL